MRRASRSDTKRLPPVARKLTSASQWKAFRGRASPTRLSGIANSCNVTTDTPPATIVSATRTIVTASSATATNSSSIISETADREPIYTAGPDSAAMPISLADRKHLNPPASSLILGVTASGFSASETLSAATCSAVPQVPTLSISYLATMSASQTAQTASSNRRKSGGVRHSGLTLPRWNPRSIYGNATRSRRSTAHPTCSSGMGTDSRKARNQGENQKDISFKTLQNLGIDSWTNAPSHIRKVGCEDPATNTYIVEDVLEKREEEGSKVVKCLIKWKGWSHEYNTWEPESAIKLQTKE